jgi:AbrB family looped-hinge helix DNA binding protein
MKEQLTTVTRKGQITVPVEIRRALDLQIGDKVAVSLDEENGALRAHLRPVRSVAEMTFGVLHSGQRAVDEEAVHDAFADHAAARDERSKRP